jgi:mono/diheme cytochrome c family protein
MNNSNREREKSKQESRTPLEILMRVTLLLLPIAGWFCLAARAAEPAPPTAVDFKREVLPILEAKCISCHGVKKQGKLDLRTRDAMLKGGNTGPALEPGKPDKSLLIELIHFNEMPPKKSKSRVTADELKLLKAWIEAGAPEK